MKIGMQGNTYLKSEFPNLDYVKSAHICGAELRRSRPKNIVRNVVGVLGLQSRYG